LRWPSSSSDTRDPGSSPDNDRGRPS
jgi:hypothetical protein